MGPNIRERFTRRDFLRLAVAGAAATLLGAASGNDRRQPVPAEKPSLSKKKTDSTTASTQSPQNNIGEAVTAVLKSKADQFPQSISEFANRRTIEDIASFIKNIHSAQTAEAAPVPDSGGGMYEVTPDGGIYVTRTNGGKGPDWGYHWNGPLLESYNKTGGFPNWGSPIARPYKDELNRIVGWTERGGFQAHTEGGRLANVEWYNTFDRATEMDKDAWLQAVRQTPPPAKYPEEEGMSLEEIVRNRLKILDQNPAIKAKYMGNGNDQFWLEKNGLPTAYKDEGNHYALRAQRAVYQQWKEDVPWAKKGEVTIALGGSIAKELGIIPEGALALQARTEVFGSPVALEKPVVNSKDIDLGANGSVIHNRGTKYAIVPKDIGATDGNGNYCPGWGGGSEVCVNRRINLPGMADLNIQYVRDMFAKYGNRPDGGQGKTLIISIFDSVDQNPYAKQGKISDSFAFYARQTASTIEVFLSPGTKDSNRVVFELNGGIIENFLQGDHNAVINNTPLTKFPVPDELVFLAAPAKLTLKQQ